MKKFSFFALVAVMGAMLVSGCFGFESEMKGKESFLHLDIEQRLQLAEEYSVVKELHEGRAIVKLGEKYGYIDANGEEVIPCILDDVWAL